MEEKKEMAFNRSDMQRHKSSCGLFGNDFYLDVLGGKCVSGSGPDRRSKATRVNQWCLSAQQVFNGPAAAAAAHDTHSYLNARTVT